MSNEARVLGAYLLGEAPGENIVVRYDDLKSTAPSLQEDRITSFVLRFPWAIYLLDPAAGLFRPRCIFRKKLALMFAVLECEPKYASKFLSPDTSDTTWFFMGVRAAWSLLRAVAGSILLIFL